MRIFLDTANIDEIREAARWGVCDGVTTNPSLFAKEAAAGGPSYRERVQEIATIVDGPISAECVTRMADELVEEARDLASWHPASSSRSRSMKRAWKRSAASAPKASASTPR